MNKVSFIGFHFDGVKATEAVSKRFSVKKVFLEISQNGRNTPVP